MPRHGPDLNAPKRGRVVIDHLAPHEIAAGLTAFYLGVWIPLAYLIASRKDHR